MKQTIAFFSFLTLFVFTSCIKHINLYQGDEDDNGNPPAASYKPYLYPYENEVQNAVAEITIQANTAISINDLTASIPHLKYNKSWLFMLTQDDCKHAAYSCTWAAINGKPLSNKYFYDAAQLHNNDLPPNCYRIAKTLGSTDGTGNEVRFHFTTTLAPEWDWMDTKTEIKKGYTTDYFRFFMKSGLVWDNVKEILNYDNSIAFHDVKAGDVYNAEDIQAHYDISQKIILQKIGRGCKMLAEPNGNKVYIDAANHYPLIQTITAQSGAVSITPFQITDDLQKTVINRTFYDEPGMLKEEIIKQMGFLSENRYAVTVGVYGTDKSWADLLLWLNNTYGKDGDDSVWFPSQEEFYEYNYYRIHATLAFEQIDERTIKLSVALPSGQYFYYPSVTVNLGGVPLSQIDNVSTSQSVTGFSYGEHNNGIMLNIDCRKMLLERATHFVEEYEAKKTDASYKADAIYFVNMLKESPEKIKLLNRIK